MSKTATAQIESGIPVPGHRGGNHKYPWAQLAVGQSFIIRQPKRRTTAGGQASRAGKNLGRQFKTAALPNGDVRVWRVK